MEKYQENRKFEKYENCKIIGNWKSGNFENMKDVD